MSQTIKSVPLDKKGKSMLSIHTPSKIAIAIALTFAAPLALANEDCVKPKVPGYSQDEMVCLGEGVVGAYDYNNMSGQPSVTLLNNKGSVIVPKGKFIDAFEFSEGLAGVVNNDYKVGYIDKTGKVIIPFKYEPAIVGEGGEGVEVSPFKQGLASVAILKKSAYGGEDSYWGFIDKNGKTIIPFKYNAAGNFGSGMAPVAVMNDSDSGYVWEYIDKTGKTAFKANYDYAGSFLDGVAVASKNEKYGVIDTKNKVVVPFKYDYIDDFSEGLAAVFQRGKPIPNSDSIRGKFGFIDKTGKVVIPIQYDLEYYAELFLPYFKNGKAKIELWQGERDKSYCINKSGKKVSC